jgi:branched-chain amino acid transport system ATP-binding protein
MLQVRHLDVLYSRVQALWDCSLQIERGEIVALLGANGAGKSTMLKAISAVVPVAAGEIVLDGQRIDGLPPQAIVARGVVQIPEGRHIFPAMTVRENLLMGGYHPSRRRTRRGALDEVFDAFSVLRERQGQLAGSLSGGEQQMLAIARALMARPSLLMLDEPSLGLAPLLIDEVFDRIRTIRAQGVTVLLVEQNTSEALAIADRGYVLENGRIAIEGPSARLLADEHVRQAYMGI